MNPSDLEPNQIDIELDRIFFFYLKVRNNFLFSTMGWFSLCSNVPSQSSAAAVSKVWKIWSIYLHEYSKYLRCAYILSKPSPPWPAIHVDCMYFASIDHLLGHSRLQPKYRTTVYTVSSSDVCGEVVCCWPKDKLMFSLSNDCSSSPTAFFLVRTAGLLPSGVELLWGK